MTLEVPHGEPELRVLPDAEALAAAAAEHLLDVTRARLPPGPVAPLSDAPAFPPASARAPPAAPAAPRVTVAFSGGKTPRRCYALLAESVAEARASLAAWEVYLADERLVPPDHPASNGRLLRDMLVKSGALAASQLHLPSPEPPHVQLPPRLDVLVLGLGDDGHTASLFPGSPALEETRVRMCATRAPVAPEGRLTLTPPALAAARHVVMLVSGAGKADALQRVLEGPRAPRELPGQLARHGRALWLVDAAAAQRLARPH
jgi:6-phosphogluconolactonase